MQQIPRWITVVIPTRDRPALVRAAVDSVLVHDGADVVVVDDSDLRSHGVVGVDRNETGVSVVAGEWTRSGSRPQHRGRTRHYRLVGLSGRRRQICCPTGSTTSASALDNEARDIGIVFCAVALRRDLDGHGELALPVDLGPAFHSARGQLLAGGFCVRRKIFESVGGYEPTLRFSENTEFVLRAIDHCASHDLATLSIDTCLASIWRRHADNRSSNSPSRRDGAANFMLTRTRRGVRPGIRSPPPRSTALQASMPPDCAIVDKPWPISRQHGPSARPERTGFGAGCSMCRSPGGSCGDLVARAHPTWEMHHDRGRPLPQAATSLAGPAPPTWNRWHMSLREKLDAPASPRVLEDPGAARPRATTRVPLPAARRRTLGALAAMAPTANGR